MNNSILKSFLSYLVILPASFGLAIFNRYGAGFQIIPEAIPMCLTFFCAFILTAAFLANRPITLNENYIFLGTISIFSSYLFSILCIVIFRWYYSLGYLTIFVTTTVTWVVILERYRTSVLFKKRYALVPFGQHQIATNLGLPCAELENSDSLGSTNLDTIVLDFNAAIPPEWAHAVATAASRGVPILSLSEFTEFATGRAITEGFSEEDFYAKLGARDYRTLKRMLDVIVAIFAVLLLLIPSLFVVLAIKLSSTGPALFIQTRVGFQGKQFTLFKFRTMFPDAGTPSTTTQKNDLRVTSIGKLLRHTRIDEWPQLINVLKGEMSIVGPRPEQSLLVDSFSRTIPNYQLRHLARPGITGWAQINHGYADDRVSTIKKLEYDLYYVKKMNFLLDIKVILKTISVLISGAGHR